MRKHQAFSVKILGNRSFTLQVPYKVLQLKSGTEANFAGLIPHFVYLVHASMVSHSSTEHDKKCTRKSSVEEYSQAVNMSVNSAGCKLYMNHLCLKGNVLKLFVRLQGHM